MKVKLIGKRKLLRPFLENGEFGEPIIKSKVEKTEEYIYKEDIEIENLPNTGELIGITEDIECEVEKIKTFLTGNAIIYLDYVFEEIVDKDMMLIVEKQKDFETKNYVDNLKNDEKFKMYSIFSNQSIESKDFLDKYLAYLKFSKMVVDEQF